MFIILYDDRFLQETFKTYISGSLSSGVKARMRHDIKNIKQSEEKKRKKVESLLFVRRSPGVEELMEH